MKICTVLTDTGTELSEVSELLNSPIPHLFFSFLSFFPAKFN